MQRSVLVMATSRTRSARYLPPSAFLANVVQGCETLVGSIEARDVESMRRGFDEVSSGLQSVIEDTTEDDAATREIVSSLLQTSFLDAIVSNHTVPLTECQVEAPPRCCVIETLASLNLAFPVQHDRQPTADSLERDRDWDCVASLKRPIINTLANVSFDSREARDKVQAV